MCNPCDDTYDSEQENESSNVVGMVLGMISAFFAVFFIMKFLKKLRETKIEGQSFNNSKRSGDVKKNSLTGYIDGTVNKGASAVKNASNVKKVTAPKTTADVSKLSSNTEKMKLNERQIRIMDLLKDEKELTMNKIQDINAGVTERTLRRDMDALERLKLVKKFGKTKGAKYVLR